MTSRIDWNRYIDILKSREKGKSDGRFYLRIFMTIRHLAKLQSFLFSKSVPQNIYDAMKGDAINAEVIVKKLNELDSHCNIPIDDSIRTKLIKAIVSLEHLLFIQLKCAKQLVKSDTMTMKQLENNSRTQLKDKVSKNKLMYLQCKINKWNDLEPLIIALGDSMNSEALDIQARNLSNFKSFSNYPSEIRTFTSKYEVRI